MMVRVTTQSGSQYTLDNNPARLAAHVLPSPTSGVRSHHILLWNLPTVEIGRGMVLFGEPLDPAADVRVIGTSPVVSVELI